MNLAETQQLFWGVIAERRAVTRAELEGVFVNAGRLEVYAGMYINRLIDALAAEFPRLAEAMGDDFFVTAEAYIQKYPSVDPSIANVGRELPRFLRARRRPELAAIATLERTRSRVFDAADEEPVAANALADIDPAVLPRVKLVPVAALAVVGETVVFRRDYVVREVVLRPVEIAALRAMMKGRTLATLCNAFAHEANPAQAAFAAIGGWLASGWVKATLVPARR